MTPERALTAALLGVPIGLALGLVGGGGSLLTVPLLIGVLGVPPKLATGASLMIVAANATGALGAHIRARRVQYRMAALIVLTGTLGTAAGTLVHARLNERALTLAFAALMVLIAVNLLRGRTPEPPADAGAHVPRRKVLLAGTLVGLTTGVFGVGGGFVIIPALLALGLGMRQAVPTSLLIIALNSVLALGLRALSGAAVPVGDAVPMGLGGLAGSALAARIAPRLGHAGLTRAFALLVLGLAGVLAWSARGDGA
ncbi:sulfite exporter TauE/SafE family protein [Deinococcus maricopensis]|uniref:Probable membrane transporter protein n=1 Tax=Deinococcus maricopensis (strain DSM 21211 / LMG 22137 / NRRL B-23946 / LB-34) TaxID=709986 RepID=E8U416_DEIML|nr:sulfite exporter TauE/SafE family protein [Deinococcus maricopensis]ADV65853.1 protein of unknown function DUF81 [Deinococcus maricopensis DSM 21211]